MFAQRYNASAIMKKNKISAANKQRGENHPMRSMRLSKEHKEEAKRKRTKRTATKGENNPRYGREAKVK